MKNFLYHYFDVKIFYSENNFQEDCHFLRLRYFQMKNLMLTNQPTNFPGHKIWEVSRARKYLSQVLIGVMVYFQSYNKKSALKERGEGILIRIESF